MESQVENQMAKWLEHVLCGWCLEPQSDCEREALAEDRRTEIPIITMHDTAFRPRTSDIMVLCARTSRLQGEESVPHPCGLVADVQVQIRTAAMGDDREDDWCQASPIHSGRVDAVFAALHSDRFEESISYMQGVCDDKFGIYCYSFQGSDSISDPDRNGRIWTGSWDTYFWVGESDA